MFSDIQNASCCVDVQGWPRSHKWLCLWQQEGGCTGACNIENKEPQVCNWSCHYHFTHRRHDQDVSRGKEASSKCWRTGVNLLGIKLAFCIIAFSGVYKTVTNSPKLMTKVYTLHARCWKSIDIVIVKCLVVLMFCYCVVSACRVKNMWMLSSGYWCLYIIDIIDAQV